MQIVHRLTPVEFVIMVNFMHARFAVDGHCSEVPTGNGVDNANNSPAMRKIDALRVELSRPALTTPNT